MNNARMQTRKRSAIEGRHSHVTDEEKMDKKCAKTLPVPTTASNVRGRPMAKERVKGKCSSTLPLKTHSTSHPANHDEIFGDDSDDEEVGLLFDDEEHEGEDREEEDDDGGWEDGNTPLALCTPEIRPPPSPSLPRVSSGLYMPEFLSYTPAKSSSENRDAEASAPPPPIAVPRPRKVHAPPPPACAPVNATPPNFVQETNTVAGHIAQYLAHVTPVKLTTPITARKPSCMVISFTHAFPGMAPFVIGLALVRAFEFNDIIFGRSPMHHPDGDYMLDEFQPVVRKQASLIAVLNRFYPSAEGNYPVDMVDKYGILFYTSLTIMDEATMQTLYAAGHERDPSWKMPTGLTDNADPRLMLLQMNKVTKLIEGLRYLKERFNANIQFKSFKTSPTLLSPLYGPAFSSDDAGDGPMPFYIRSFGTSAKVIYVSSSSAAYESGLRTGDIITHVNGVPSETFTDIKGFYDSAIENQDKLTFVRQNDSLARLNRTECRKRKRHIEPKYQSLAVTWDYDNPCKYCNCVFYVGCTPEFRKHCCMSGRAINLLPELKPLPEYITRRVCDPKYIRHFCLSASYYNNQLALGAVKVDNGKGGGWERIKGPHSVRLNGRLHHYLPSGKISGLHYFTFDALPLMRQNAEAINQTHGDGYRINSNFLEEFYRGLKITNRLVQECEQIGRYSKAITNGTITQQTNDVVVDMENPVHHFEVACVVGANNPGELKLQYHIKGCRSPSTIPTIHPLYEPLSYPLLFPYGEDGWSSNLNADHKCTLMQYLRCRMLMPEPNLIVSNQDGTRQLNVNRFQLMSRLGQTYLVDNMSRIIDMELNYYKRRQQPNYKEAHDPSTTRTFLGSSFFGGRRHLAEQAQNALTIVSEYGAPTFFITLTCNPLWSEITERIGIGDTAYSRPDVTCMVFHEKLKRMLFNLRKGKYFKFGAQGPKYEMRVIEYQYRGLPHCHLVVCDPNAPSRDDPDAVSKYIDSNIAACFPINESEDNTQYVSLIRSKMLHRCSKGPNGCIKNNSTCKAGYDRTICSLFSIIGSDGYVQYRRPKPQDLLVVPHVKELLLDWNGHANVEYCGSCLTVMYLYKYMFKGAKNEKFRLLNADDIENKDEIGLYLRGRVLTSQDSMWRVLGYHTYPKTTPQVIVVKITEEDKINELLSENKLCDLVVYMHRPPQLEKKLFTEVFTEYIRSSRLPKRAKNSEYFQIRIPGFKGTQYLIQRQRGQHVLCRMGMLYCTAGEPYYLRMILLHKPCRSYKDAKTVNNFEFDSFQEACYYMGIINRNDEAYACLKENIVFSTPAQLRSLFTTLTIQGYPTLSAYSDQEIQTAMKQDFRIKRGYNEASEKIITNDLLLDLHDRFTSMGRNLADFRLPTPVNTMKEIVREQMRYDITAQMLHYNELCLRYPNNAEQDDIMKEIIEMEALPGSTKLMFVQGQAGTGKTNLGRKILAYMRSRGHIAFALASTGLAATLYDNGLTAHAFFNIEVRDDDREEDCNNEAEHKMLQCKISKESERQELIDHTRCILWDEFPSNHSDVFEAAYYRFGGFNGKIIVCMGDFKQIPPVVKYGTRTEIVKASIRSHELWKHFEVYELKKNMRLEREIDRLNKLIESGKATEADYTQLHEQIRYGELLLTIGRGMTSDQAQLLDQDPITGRQLLRMPSLPFFTEKQTEEAMRFVFGTDRADCTTFKRRHILVATNSLGDDWNAKIQKMNPNPECELYSLDKLCSVDDPHKHLARMLTEEVLNKYNANGVPPHNLKLKVDDICIVLRTLSKKDELTTNTTVRILNIIHHCITAVTIGGNSRKVLIPRIHFKFKLPYGKSFTLLRRQFPLRLAYAITLNKCQGQEGDAFLFDTRDAPFTMGHAYVGLSRAFTKKSIALFTYEQNVINGAAMLINVTFPEMLTNDDKSFHDAQKEPSIYPKILIPPQHMEFCKLDDVKTYFKKRNGQNSPERQAELLVHRSAQEQLKLLREAKFNAVADENNSVEEFDNIQNEVVLLEQTLYAQGRQIVDVPRGPNNMFHAVRYYLILQNFLHEATTVQKMRDIAIETIQKDHHNFIDASTPISAYTSYDGTPSSFNLQTYLTTMRDTSTYADYLILYALCYYYKLSVTLFFHDSTLELSIPKGSLCSDMSDFTHESTIELACINDKYFMPVQETQRLMLEEENIYPDI